MEAYLYFNIEPDQVVFHFLGEPTETRHIVVRDKQLIISPSWVYSFWLWYEKL